jgi:hypothetical protein
MNSNLVLHAIILKKPDFESKEEAHKYAKTHFNEHLKNKKFIRETDKSFRVRVHPKQQFDKTTFVSKVISPQATLVFGTPNEKYRGGAIDQKELKQFVLLQADVTANSPDNQALLKRFGLFGPPGILFFNLNSEEQKDQRVIGYMPPQRFLDRLLKLP